MSEHVSLEELGRKIRRIRKLNGFSQNEIASIIKIPRSAVVQIEKGNRNISIIELLTLSQALGFSIDKFLTSSYEQPIDNLVVHEPAIESEVEVLRNSVPVLNRAKLDNVLLYITGACGAKPNMDINLLMNLLYFCDFNYYEIHEEQLTGLQYTKQSFGPSPEQLFLIIKEMEADKKLLRFKSSYSGKPHVRYLPGTHANLKEISAAAKKVIDQVIDQFSDWPAEVLNSFSKEDMPWKASDLGEPIDYELVFYRKLPYSVRIYKDDYNKK
jgi:transcriptional regulator with XRE-family HTH domain